MTQVPLATTSYIFPQGLTPLPGMTPAITGDQTSFVAPSLGQRLWSYISSSHAAADQRRVGEVAIAALKAGHLTEPHVTWIINQTYAPDLGDPTGHTLHRLIAALLTRGFTAPVATLQARYRAIPAANKALDRWTEKGYSEEAYWRNPDFIHMLFTSRLWLHIFHPAYNNDANAITFTTAHEPCLLVEAPDGETTHCPWSSLGIRWDENWSVFCSGDVSTGTLVEWNYLDRGFVRCPRMVGQDLTALCPVKRFAPGAIPDTSTIYLATAHETPGPDRSMNDHFSAGSARHPFIIFIIGRDLADLLHMTPGIYAIGWGGTNWGWDGMPMLQLLTTFAGLWLSIDFTFWTKYSIATTPLSSDPATIIRALQGIQAQNLTFSTQNSNPKTEFNFFRHNCAQATAELLLELGLISGTIDNYTQYIGLLWFQMLAPVDVLQWFYDCSVHLEQHAPWLLATLQLIGALFELLWLVLHSILTAPLICLLGGTEAYAPPTTTLYPQRPVTPLSSLSSRPLLGLLDPRNERLALPGKIFNGVQRNNPMTRMIVQDRDLRTHNTTITPLVARNQANPLFGSIPFSAEVAKGTTYVHLPNLTPAPPASPVPPSLDLAPLRALRSALKPRVPHSTPPAQGAASV